MVLQKLFSFNKGSSSSNIGVRFNPSSTSIEYSNGSSGYNYPNGDYGDDEGTIGSQNTYQKSILRRRNEKRNTDRNVSWSNTFDTYEEGGAPPSPGAGGHGQYLGQDMDMDDLIDMVDTLDTIDTYEQGGRMAAAYAAAAANGGIVPETRQDTNAYLPGYYGVQQQQQPPPQQSYESDTLINNGRDKMVESLSISEDGEVEVHVMKPPGANQPPPPPGMMEAPRQVERKQLEQVAPLQQPMVQLREQPPPPPMNNHMMVAPRQQERKHLGQTLSFPPQQQYQPPLRPSAAMFQRQMVQLPEQVSEYRNLACISNVSDSTLELMRDRYGGLGGGGDDEIQEQQDVEEVREKANSPGSSSAEHNTRNSSQEEGVKEVVKTSSSFLSNPFKKKSKEKTEPVQVSTEKQVPSKQEESAVKPSPVFIPRELELPEQVHLAFSDSGSLGSLSMDELDDTTLFDNLDTNTLNTLFDRLDDKNGSHDEDTVTRNEKRAGHNHGHGDYIVRAASDDESIASLTRKHSDYDVMFKKQQEADKSGGHIGLILPFLNTGRVEFKAPTWGDMETLKNDLLKTLTLGTSMSSSGFMGESSSSKDGESRQFSSASFSNGTSASNDGESKLSSAFFTNGTLSPSDAESKLSSAFFSNGTSKESADDTKNDVSRSMDSSEGKTKSLSMASASEDQMKSVSYSASVATEDGSSPDKDGVESNAPAENVGKKNVLKAGPKKTNSSSKTKDGSSDDKSVLSSKSLIDNESTEEECEEVEDVPSDDSTEVNSAQLSTDNDESDDSFVINDPGQVIELQDLVGNKSSETRKLLKKKLSRKNKKKKAAQQQQQSQPPSQIITDPSIMWNDDMFLVHRNNDVTNKASKSRLGKIRWSLKRGNKNRSTDNDLNSDAPYASTSAQSSRFVPNLLPTGKVYEADDNASVISQASSCVTTASILSELKLIEDTAKVMYQQMKALSEHAAGGGSGAGPSGMASHNNISSLWGGAQQQEAELVQGEGEKRGKKNDRDDDGPMAITCGDLQFEAGELYDVDEIVDAEQQQLQQQEQTAAKKRGSRLSKMFVKLKSKKTGRGVAATLSPKQ